jgi:hypothetical protein
MSQIKQIKLSSLSSLVDILCSISLFTHSACMLKVASEVPAQVGPLQLTDWNRCEAGSRWADCASLSNKLAVCGSIVRRYRSSRYTLFGMSSGQSSWLRIQRSWVRFPTLPDFLRSSGSGTGSTAS